ncbi:MAG TPA: glycoside hydrolase family 15 protein, partial [Tepidisphaeraceae bacterium]|nr:glycoside hydrolase family 15 protein [Tepidisphaeraceae bacterium]
VRIEPLQGRREDYHLYVLLSPRLGDQGRGNTAWVGNYKGVGMLFAQCADYAMALACSSGWRARSVGFVGASDAWQDIMRHKRMTCQYTRAENGHVALAGELDLRQGGEIVLALGLGENVTTAALKARLSLEEEFDRILQWHAEQWRSWQDQLLPLDEQSPQQDGRDLYRESTAVLETHRSLELSGGGVASLTVPWGEARTDQNMRGYQLVWTRDLVGSASGLLAAGAMKEPRNTLRYLQGTQEADGHWSQMMWLDGSAYGVQVQMDESALPILLSSLGHREGAIDEREMQGTWPMLRAATLYMLLRGPVTPGDRWENAAGYSPYTLATEIAALVVAAEWADRLGERALATLMRETADAWNSGIEEWTYLKGTELARRVGVEGYYLRIAPPDGNVWQSLGSVPELPAAEVVSPDALALVRFGLRRADDPRILSTLRVIDAELRVQTPLGPCWRRYSGDHYGESEDGAPYPGYGTKRTHGRCWPLLTGERAHYELAAGHLEEARRLLATMSQFANRAGMIPEQVWDAPDIPEKGLCCGRPSGSAMPLAWAHGEYVKLRRSIRDDRVFDLPEQAHRRYVVEGKVSPRVIWRFTHQTSSMPPGKRLRIETLARARVHFSLDGWQSVRDQATTDTGLGLHITDLPTESVRSGGAVQFTFFWPEPQRWEGRDFVVRIDDTGNGRPMPGTATSVMNKELQRQLGGR